MNVEIGTEAPIFLFWEYLFQIFGILSLQCREIAHNCMIMVTENKAAQFDFWEYIIRIFFAVQLSQLIFGALLFNPCEGLMQCVKVVSLLLCLLHLLVISRE
jgi:hypothetical protein